MADRVDALVDTMEPSGPAARRDRRVVQPERTELLARDDAVLRSRERRQLAIRGGRAGS
jgi:hypothetical protein